VCSSDLIGWNDYDAGVAKRTGIKRKIKVICLNTQEIFDSSKEVAQKYNIQKTSVNRLCKHRDNSKFISVDDKPFVFMYYDEYLTEDLNSINCRIQIAQQAYLKCAKLKKVVCLNTLVSYNSIQEAQTVTGVCASGISNCCYKKQKFAGELADGQKNGVDVL
jgi:hypothetical protein